jgi:hypothetical protein
MGSINHLMVAFIIPIAVIPMVIGLVFFLVIEEYLKRKLYLIAGGILFYLLLIPMVWIITDIKLQTFLLLNGRELEVVATDILSDKIDVATANNLLIQHGYLISIVCVPEEKKHVMFLIDGFIDNCYGFSYSLSHVQPLNNCCGQFTSWKKLRKKWFKFTTT